MLQQEARSRAQVGQILALAEAPQASLGQVERALPPAERQQLRAVPPPQPQEGQPTPPVALPPARAARAPRLVELPTLLAARATTALLPIQDVSCPPVARS